jgi:hypothetical protein
MGLFCVAPEFDTDPAIDSVADNSKKLEMMPTGDSVVPVADATTPPGPPEEKKDCDGKDENEDDKDKDCDEGCTPGYWKQEQHFGNWPPPYQPTDLFSAYFEDAFPGKTLLEVLSEGGGGLTALGRQTVAALLNAASPKVDFCLCPQKVIDKFNEAFVCDKDFEDLKCFFEKFNERCCPLGRAEDNDKDGDGKDKDECDKDKDEDDDGKDKDECDKDKDEDGDGKDDGDDCDKDEDEDGKDEGDDCDGKDEDECDKKCDEGCTPGYWKQEQHFGNWPPPYQPTDLFSAYFEDAFPGQTLLDVLSEGGGGLTALGRQTVAALLNAASPKVDFCLCPQKVIDKFNEVFVCDKDFEDLKCFFEEFNERCCPLGRADDKDGDDGDGKDGDDGDKDKDCDGDDDKDDGDDKD